MSMDSSSSLSSPVALKEGEEREKGIYRRVKISPMSVYTERRDEKVVPEVMAQSYSNSPTRRLESEICARNCRVLIWTVAAAAWASVDQAQDHVYRSSNNGVFSVAAEARSETTKVLFPLHNQLRLIQLFSPVPTFLAFDF